MISCTGGENDYVPSPYESSPANGFRTQWYQYGCRWANAAQMVEDYLGAMDLDVSGTGHSYFNHWTMYTAGHQQWMQIHTANNTPILPNIGNRINADYVYCQIPGVGPYDVKFRLFPTSSPDCNFNAYSYWSGSQHYCRYWSRTLHFGAGYKPYPTNTNDYVAVNVAMFCPCN